MDFFCGKMVGTKWIGAEIDWMGMGWMLCSLLQIRPSMPSPAILAL